MFVLSIDGEVGKRPRIQSAGLETVVRVGHDVQFTCDAYGTPNPFILWYRNDSILDQRHPRFVLLNVKTLCEDDVIISVH